MANSRYKLLQDIYMKLDGQWQIVLAGTVFDDKNTVQYAGVHASVLSPAEPAAVALAAHGAATSVRGVRTK